MDTNETKGELVFSRTIWPLQVSVRQFNDDDSGPRLSLKLSRSFRRKGSAKWEHSTIYLPLTDALTARQLLADGFSAAHERRQAIYDEGRANADEVAEEVAF